MRVEALQRLGFMADLNAAVGEVTHDGRQQRTVVLIRQDYAHAATYSGNQRIGSAQVYANRQLVLMRYGAHAGFCDLQ